MLPDLPDVGQRIRILREQKSLSLRALAERSGLSINAISLIERGENSPTVSSLHLLAMALDVSIIDFFEQGAEQTTVFVRPEHRLYSQANGIVMESLGIGLPNQQLQPFLITVAPGAGKVDQPIRHTGEEFIYCLQGEVEYCVAESVYKLEPGCSLLFQAMLPHCFRNITHNPAVLMMIFQTDKGSQMARHLHLESNDS